MVKKVKTLDEPPNKESDPRFMSSLARGLTVLSSFDGRPSLTVTQATKLTGLPRSSVSRCLFTLAHLGYLGADGLSYRLRPTLLPLLRAYASSDPLAKAGQQIVDHIRNRLNVSCSLAIFDARQGHDAVIYICRAEISRIISVPLLVGSTLPSYCTSMGRVLLANLAPERLENYLSSTVMPVRTSSTIVNRGLLSLELDDARRKGWALIDGELEPGLRSIAVPVRTVKGQVVAALNVATQTNQRSRPWLIKTALPELQAAAAHLARII